MERVTIELTPALQAGRRLRISSELPLATEVRVDPSSDDRPEKLANSGGKSHRQGAPERHPGRGA